MGEHVDTAGMRAEACRNRMPHDAELPEGAAIAVLFAAAVALVALAGVAAIVVAAL